MSEENNFEIKVGIKGEIVIVDFQRQVQWLAFTPEQAIAFSKAILETTSLLVGKFGGMQ
jgi:hypothetical protein